MNRSLCPRCNTKWSFAPTDQTGWKTCQCGMRYSSFWSRYKLIVGCYIVFWDIDDDNRSRMWIEGTGKNVYRGEALPFDITEEMVSLLATFS